MTKTEERLKEIETKCDLVSDFIWDVSWLQIKVTELQPWAELQRWVRAKEGREIKITPHSIEVWDGKWTCNTTPEQALDRIKNGK